MINKIYIIRYKDLYSKKITFGKTHLITDCEFRIINCKSSAIIDRLSKSALYRNSYIK